MIRVSVQIVTYNSEKDINDCIEAVIKQTFPPSEIIVVDNASMDGTWEKLVQLKDVKIVKNDKNVGFAGAHNQAIRLTKSDYVFILNPDVTLHPDYLLHLVQFLESNVEFGSATGLLLRKSLEPIIDSTGIRMFKNRRAIDRGSGEDPIQYQANSEVFGVSGAAALYKRSMIDDISWKGQFFDEDFFAYKEDVDVAWRARLFGWKAYYQSRAIAYHERGWKEGTRLSKPLFLRRHSYINRYKMMVKNENWKQLIFHLPYIFPFELASMGYTLLRDPKVLSAWRTLWRNYPNLLAKRAWVQEQRRVPFQEVYQHFD